MQGFGIIVVEMPLYLYLLRKQDDDKIQPFYGERSIHEVLDVPHLFSNPRNSTANTLTKNLN